MREMRRRTQIMYSRFFISFKPPFCLRLEVDIQQLIFPIKSILLNIYKNKLTCQSEICYLNGLFVIVEFRDSNCYSGV